MRLPAATAADADALLAAWAIKGGEARKAARPIAHLPGGLGGLDRALKLASILSPDNAVSAQHARTAWKDLGGPG